MFSLFLFFHQFFQGGQRTPFAPMCGRPCADCGPVRGRTRSASSRTGVGGGLSSRRPGPTTCCSNDNYRRPLQQSGFLDRFAKLRFYDNRKTSPFSPPGCVGLLMLLFQYNLTILSDRSSERLPDQCRINHVADVANATGLRPQGASGSREKNFSPSVVK